MMNSDPYEQVTLMNNDPPVAAPWGGGGFRFFFYIFFFAGQLSGQSWMIIPLPHLFIYLFIYLTYLKDRVVHIS